ncbi:MAG: hypothetical protein QME12_01400 [Nanoarchaeota archaeon]|nr:hypothetical protein [Nanoarchaeota archaeon]
MDIIVGEEIIRIASDEPRFPYRSGKALEDEKLNTLLMLSRYEIVVEDPSKLWGYAVGGRIKIKDGRMEREN